MKSPFVTIVVAILLSSISLVAHAQYRVANGELFGYRLGDRYTLLDGTKKQSMGGPFGGVEIRADRPNKPDDIDDVWLNASPRTLTIGSIAGVRRFKKRPDAEQFAENYTKNFLLTAFPRDDKAVLRDFGPEMDVAIENVRATVSVVGPTSATHIYVVRIELQFNPGTGLAKKIERLYVSENLERR